MGKMGNSSSTFRSVVLDFSGFALLLAGLNAVLANADPLWLSANPNPWLLLPVYLGCRYGFVAGCVSGLVTALVAAIIAAGKGDLTLPEALLAHRPLLLGFPVGGVLTGSVRSLLNHQLNESEAKALAAEEENARLRTDNAVIDETRHQLQQRLALFGAETCALDQQLRALFAPGAGPVLARFLMLLRSAANVSSSCIVEFKPDRSGRVIAALDSKWKQGDNIPDEKLAMARAALEEKSIITWKAKAPLPESDFLAAVPWSVDGCEVVVLVEDMPFTAISHPGFVRIDFIVRWVARFIPNPAETEATTAAVKDTSPADAFVSVDEFESHGELARETFERLRLPSVIAEFEDSSPTRGSEGQGSVIELLKTALQEQVRAPRVACAATDSGKLRVLLPMEGPRDAEVFATALLHPLEAAGNVKPGRIRHQLIEIGANGSNRSNGDSR